MTRRVVRNYGGFGNSGRGKRGHAQKLQKLDELDGYATGRTQMLECRVCGLYSVPLTGGRMYACERATCRSRGA